MKLIHFTAVSAFVERTAPFLLAHEAHNNLLLGLCTELASNPSTYGSEPPVMLTVEDGGSVVLAALQTPPHQLVLAHTK
jgi:uncharacterized protein